MLGNISQVAAALMLTADEQLDFRAATEILEQIKESSHEEWEISFQERTLKLGYRGGWYLRELTEEEIDEELEIAESCRWRGAGFWGDE